MKVADFEFSLPAELVAQTAAPRGTSRLLVLDRANGDVTHATIRDLPCFVRTGDLLVANDTRVFPARLLGRRVPSGGAVECLLLARERDAAGTEQGRSRDGAGTQTATEAWEALMHPGQKLKPGAGVVFEGARTLHGEVVERR